MANTKKCLVDTSVLIALFRKNENAKLALDSLAENNAYICDITFLEILAGCSFAIYYNMELLTFNKKDFDFIQDINIHNLSK